MFGTSILWNGFLWDYEGTQLWQKEVCDSRSSSPWRRLRVGQHLGSPFPLLLRSFTSFLFSWSRWVPPCNIFIGFAMNDSLLPWFLFLCTIGIHLWQEQATLYEKLVFDAVSYLVSKDTDDDVAVELHLKVSGLSLMDTNILRECVVRVS